MRQFLMRKHGIPPGAEMLAREIALSAAELGNGDRALIFLSIRFMTVFTLALRSVRIPPVPLNVCFLSPCELIHNPGMSLLFK